MKIMLLEKCQPHNGNLPSDNVVNIKKKKKVQEDDSRYNPSSLRSGGR
jgi:hypothetical protein